MCFGNLKGDAPSGIGGDMPVRKVSTISNNSATNDLKSSGKRRKSSDREANDIDVIKDSRGKSLNPFSNSRGPISRRDEGEALEPYRSNTINSFEDAQDQFQTMDVQAHAQRKTDPEMGPRVNAEAQSNAAAQMSSFAGQPEGEKKKKRSFMPEAWGKYEPTEKDIYWKEKLSMSPEEARKRTMRLPAGITGPGAGAMMITGAAAM